MFVWVGNNASPAEKKNGLPVAHVSMLVGWPFCVCVTHVCVNGMYVFLSVRAYMCVRVCERDMFAFLCVMGVCVCVCVRACVHACACVCVREICLPFCV